MIRYVQKVSILVQVPVALHLGEGPAEGKELGVAYSLAGKWDSKHCGTG